ncbi:MAG: SDR family oxidoreductase [Myxococcales bacterium]|nr:SDR family oxidoreductase [Myxococcales bacterium]
MDLAGKVALVTGGARRVGRAIAFELSRAGAQLVIHFHESRAEAAAVAAKLATGSIVQADLRDAAACRALIDAVHAQHGRLDLLINNAADYRRAPFAYEEEAAWSEQLALNLVAPARLVRLALPLGISSVVNIVDVAAWQPWKHHAAYAASKAGLVQLTRNLALELAPSVRVNAVAPGTVVFPPDFSDGEQDAIIRRIPLERIGDPADVARAVRFLCSEDYLTGVVLPVDGGAHLR